MPELEVKKTGEKEGLTRRPLFDFPHLTGNLFHMNPFALMREFTDEMDRFFTGHPGEKKLDVWTPLMEVKRVNGNLVMKAELPGLGNDDIKVQVTGDALVVEGERKEEKKEEGEEYFRTERSYGHFYRSLALPEGADIEHVKAEFANGILEVTVPCPKKEPVKKDVPVVEPSKPKAA